MNSGRRKWFMPAANEIPDPVDMTSAANLPGIPDRIRLRFLPGTWSPHNLDWPAEPLDILAVGVVPHGEYTDRVWLAGHGLECDWSSSDCADPCRRVIVMRDALDRALARAATA